MNINKIEKLHRKIGQLIQSIREDDAPSAIEKDLLKSYIRNMYEHVLFDKKKDHSGSTEYKTSEVVNQRKEEVKQEVVENSSFSLDQVVKEEVVSQSIPEPAPIPVTPPPTPQVVEEVVAAIPKVEIPDELDELFAHADVSELSDRLSRTPIDDLTRCMGINEKIFTMNELFGGDSSLFNNTMSDLNNLDSLDQAKDYLVEKVALEQGWADPGKIKKADKFIKLISRKYN